MDIWSAGVICFLLLSDEFPFFGETKEDLIASIQKGDFSFSGSHWGHVSSLGKIFVSKLLSVDENERPTAAEALRHPWILRSTLDESMKLHPVDFDATTKALSNVMTFSAKSKLAQATYSLIASQFLFK